MNGAATVPWGASPAPETGGRGRTAAAAAVLSLVAALWLLPDLGRMGLTWDEPRYFTSAGRIQEWTAELVRGPDRARTASAVTIRRVWDADHYWNPHPPVYKEAMALTERLARGRLDPIRGFRLASLVWFALLVGAVTCVAGRTWGTTAGVGAGLSLLLMPRLFGHAHVAATDTPLTLFWFAASAGFALYALRGGRAAIWIGALALGLGMGTKFTAWLVPLPILVWLLVYRRRADAAIGFLGWMAGGLIVSTLLNPLAWHDPLAYASRLFSESLTRREAVPIDTFYLGRQYGFDVPWHHPIVMTAITVPLPILVLALAGSAVSAPRLRRDPVAGLAALNVGFFWALLALPSSPNHDGVRLFLPLFPFLALLAGRGFAALAGGARARLSGRAATLAGLLLGVLFFYPPYLQQLRVAPLYLSYYNELIGGPRGASASGMEPTYWYDAVTPDFLARVNERLPQDAKVATFPRSDYFAALQAYRLLRPDITLTDEWPAPYYLIVARKAVFGPLQWAVYHNVRPILAVSLDGVLMAGLYAWDAAGEPPVVPADASATPRGSGGDER